MNENEPGRVNYEQLIAYIDGGLDELGYQRIKKLIRQDSKMQARADALIQMRELIQLAYKDI